MVSVIIPTYNRHAFLADAIDSVLAQTYTDLEVIVVDDGSTDSTALMVKERFGPDPRVRYFYQNNAERCVARNRGIAESRGEFLAFLDSDDLWLPSKIEKQVRLFADNPDVGMVYSWWSDIDVDGNHLQDNGWMGMEGQTHGLIFRQLLQGNILSLATSVVRRSVINDVGGFTLNPGLLCFEDWELWTRISYKHRIEFVPEPLALLRTHPGNTRKAVTPQVYSEYLGETFRYVDKQDASTVGRLACQFYMDMFRDLISKSNREDAKDCLIRALRLGLPHRFVLEMLRRKRACLRFVTAGLLPGFKSYSIR